MLLVLFSFIVQLPSGIIACTSPKSLFCRCVIYLSISVSEWWVLNIGCGRNDEERVSVVGRAEEDEEGSVSEDREIGEAEVAEGTEVGSA